MLSNDDLSTCCKYGIFCFADYYCAVVNQLNNVLAYAFVLHEFVKRLCLAYLMICRVLQLLICFKLNYWDTLSCYLVPVSIGVRTLGSGLSVVLNGIQYWLNMDPIVFWHGFFTLYGQQAVCRWMDSKKHGQAGSWLRILKHEYYVTLSRLETRRAKPSGSSSDLICFLFKYLKRD